jgi:hypothetical protein
MNHKLIDKVIDQIREDFDRNDLSALVELLERIPEPLLRGYLSEIHDADYVLNDGAKQ